MIYSSDPDVTFAEPAPRRHHHPMLKPLGIELTRRRERLNLSQDEVAARAGLSRQAVMRLERGDCGQTFTLAQVLNALGLELTVQEIENS